jgi:cation diffusion facilitator CzcD-associated flavoprotein CzcO
MTANLDAVIIGAGFAGMYMLHRLRGKGFSARVIEAGKGVGGTWYWNRYPGARCDVESVQYSYQFSPELEQEWEWTERYATQPEILKYANHVADRYDLRRDIQFETRVTGAEFVESNNSWVVGTDKGQRLVTRFVITAMGCLSSPNTPRWDYGGLGFMASFNDLLLNDDSNKTAADFVREKIREIVKDPRTAEILSPTNIIGCKRLCVDSGYWETFNRPNVTLVDIREEPIERITPTGARAQGQDYDFDCLVLATGFDAMTGALLKVDIRGRNGVTLKEKWGEGPKTYLGLTVVGFPNLFTITGPGSPSVLTNMLPSIEQHVDWIADCLEALRAKGVSVIEPVDKAEAFWAGEVGGAANITLRSTCSSWYVGANIPGKPRVFMPYIGGLPAYIERCEAVVAKGYEGFALR